jgi:hypothetical protein
MMGAAGMVAAAAEGVAEVVEVAALSSGNLDARDSRFFFSAAKTWKKSNGSSSSESASLSGVPVSTI